MTIPTASLRDSGHTPGPCGYTWHEDEVEIFDGTSENPDCELLYIYASGDSLICSRADARLIAAAPDLLEALEAARFWIGMQDRQSPELGNLIAAAIAKAKGSDQ